jgi:chromosome segregation ATPase
MNKYKDFAMATDIEKENLEAHVELCAERYKNLDTKLNSLDDRMSRVEELIVSIKETLASAPESSNKTIITIGTTLMGALIGGLFTLVVHIK